jgi:exodeoxyribonuclease VIII
MRESEYRAAPGVNWSALKHIGVSPLYYRHMASQSFDSPAMLVGRAVHCAVLEPEAFESRYVTQPDFGDLRTKAGKAMRDAFNPGGREVLTVAQRETVSDMATAVSQHDTANRLVRGLTHRELPVFWTDAATGLRCKGRLDGVGPGYILSLKTAREDTPEAFGRAYFQRLYHGQAAFYADGHGQALPEVTIVVQNHAPYDVWVLDTPDEAIDEGRRVYGDLLERLAACDGVYTAGAVPERAVLPVPKYVRLEESTDVFGGES